MKRPINNTSNNINTESQNEPTVISETPSNTNTNTNTNNNNNIISSTSASVHPTNDNAQYYYEPQMQANYYNYYNQYNQHQYPPYYSSHLAYTQSLLMNPIHPPLTSLPLPQIPPQQLSVESSQKRRKVEVNRIDEKDLIAMFDGDKVSEEIFEKMIPFMELTLPQTAFQRYDNGSRGVITQRGSLLNSDCDVVIHCCNCFHKMSAGVASKIKRNYPLAFETDKHTPKNDERKLGHYSAVLVDEIITFVNLYAQFDYGSTKRKINYAALLLGLKRLVENLKKIDKAWPKIGTYHMGCYNSGGSREIITQILNNVFVDYPVYLFTDKQ